MVFATQNPIEQEGTYPLPEAQVDRFLLKVKIDYPKAEEERAILDRMAGSELPNVARVMSHEAIQRMADRVLGVYMDERIRDYMVSLVCSSCTPRDVGLAEVAHLIAFGGSLRDARVLARGAGDGVPPGPRLRGSRGRQGGGSRRAPPPHPAHLRGRSGERDDRTAHRAPARAGGGAVRPGTGHRAPGTEGLAG